MRHFGPKIETEKDESLRQYLQDVVRRHQSSRLDLRRPDIYSNHEIRDILINSTLSIAILKFYAILFT
jgi:hypothetical protein